MGESHHLEWMKYFRKLQREFEWFVGRALLAGTLVARDRHKEVEEGMWKVFLAVRKMVS